MTSAFRGPLRVVLIVLAGIVGLACKAHNHSHEHEHGHDHGSESAEKERPVLAITRWTERYELFVELPAPAPGKPVTYHAHVTRLDGFQAVTEGRFRFRFKTPGGVAAETGTYSVERPGIFVPEGRAPAAGSYTLEAEYEDVEGRDIFDCGTVKVSNPPVAPPKLSGSTITFLKESQWKIQFGTSRADEQLLATELELPATVEPAGSDQLTVGAPTGGRFFHSSKLELAEGLPVKKGDVLGSIVPTVAGDDYNRLQFAVEEARLAKAQLEREIERVEELVGQNLLPERRLTELKNQLDTENARLGSAGSRLRSVTASGGEGGIAVKTSIEGLVSQVLVPNGEPVEGGSPLVRIGGTERLWVRARFVARPATSFAKAAPAAVRLPNGARIELSDGTGRFLSLLPVVETSSRVATWIVDVTREGKGGQAASPDLRPGVSVVLSVRLGKPEKALAVKRSTVVEINTRSYVFVQVDGEHFEKRPVTLGRIDGAFVEILSGLSKGDRVVETGGFDVHLASLMGSVESHRH